MCEKMQVLFVDDEVRILDGLRRMLRSVRREWEIFFAVGGKEALEVLADRKVDAVVSDMRMPGMDGVTLLREVRKQYPHIVRVALSGQASKVSVFDSIGLVHQYQAKPCDPNLLKTMLRRIRLLREILPDESLRARLTALQSVPALPGLRDELTGQLRSEHVSMDNVASIISHSLGMSARLVQLASSTFFALPIGVMSPSDAANFLGAEVLGTLESCPQAFSEFEPDALPVAFVAAVESHSLVVADFASRIALLENAEKQACKEAYLAGLFHDIGKVVSAELFPQKADPAMAIVPAAGTPVSRIEQGLFGASHAAIGAYLMGIWGLTDPVVEALARHHCPGESESPQFGPLAAVHVADVFAHEIHGADPAGLSSQLDEEYLSRLGLTSRLDVWRQACQEASHKEIANV